MGKGFTLQNTEGNDLADMFHKAFERKVKYYDMEGERERLYSYYKLEFKCQGYCYFK